MSKANSNASLKDRKTFENGKLYDTSLELIVNFFFIQKHNSCETSIQAFTMRKTLGLNKKLESTPVLKWVLGGQKISNYTYIFKKNFI